MNYIKSNYWKIDCFRAFGSWRWWWAVLGVFLAFVFCSINMYNGEIGLVDIIDQVFWGRMVMLTIPFCTFVFGDSLCADCEKKYYRLLCLRGNIESYTWSKIGIGFISACITMLMGFMLFCFILSCKFPIMLGGNDYTYQYTQSYGRLLQTNHCFLYFFILGLQFGFLAGILTTAGMAVSAYVSNRLLVFGSPLFLYYLLINVFSYVGGETPYLQLHLIFKACHSKPWKNDGICFVWVFLVSIIFVLLMGKITKWGMNRRLIND